MKIIIFGAGNIGIETLLKIKKQDYHDEVVAVLDNDRNKWGLDIADNYVISNPEKISKLSFDYIVIATVYDKEIRKQLNSYNSEWKILSLVEYWRSYYSRYAYYKKYTNEKESYDRKFTDKLIVYTAITGDYDELKDPLFFSEDIEYICFTNDKKIKSEKWNMVYIHDDCLDNMHLAKKIKVLPHLYLPENVTSMWIDGKFQVKDDLRGYVKKYEKSKPMLCFPHFARNCIFEEAAKCVVDGIGNKSSIIHQIAKYERENYPYDNGLYEMGCIVRNNNDVVVKSLMEDWWNEINEHSYRDQISFPYVCWKKNFVPDICDLDLYNNQWLMYSKHNQSR